MKTRVTLRFALVGVVCALACVASASAQAAQGAEPGRLRGAVRDRYGVIPGAEVILVSDGSRAQRSAMTNEDGEYAFTSVLPGTYTVCVSLPGFDTEERRDVHIGTRQSPVLNFVLDAGAATEQVAVTGEASVSESRRAGSDGEMTATKVSRRDSICKSHVTVSEAS